MLTQRTAPTSKRSYSIADAILDIGISRRSVYYLLAQGVLESTGAGTKRRITKESFERVLAMHRIILVTQPDRVRIHTHVSKVS